MYVTKKCYQSDDFKNGVIMEGIYVKRRSEDSYMSNICPYLQPITFHCQRSMYALMMLIDNASDKVSKAEKSITHPF